VLTHCVAFVLIERGGRHHGPFTNAVHQPPPRQPPPRQPPPRQPPPRQPPPRQPPPQTPHPRHPRITPPYQRLQASRGVRPH
jgi:hypothetical protein